MRFYSEKKYIIYRKNNKLKHFIFPNSQYHDNFIKDNGIAFINVLETGLLISGKPCIIICQDKIHLKRREALTLYSDRTIKAREAESRYLYKSKVYSLPIGD